MPSQTTADRLVTRAVNYIDRGLATRISLGNEIDDELIRGIIQALVDKAKGCGVEKDEVDSRGIVHHRVYTIAPDAKAARILFELKGMYTEGVAALVPAISKAKRDLAGADLAGYQQKFIEAQTDRTKKESEAYTITQVSPETIESAMSHLVTAILGHMDSISLEDMIEQNCAADETHSAEDNYQRYKRRFGQFIKAQLAITLEEVRSNVIPPALGAITVEEEEE